MSDIEQHVREHMLNIPAGKVSAMQFARLCNLFHVLACNHDSDLDEAQLGDILYWDAEPFTGDQERMLARAVVAYLNLEFIEPDLMLPEMEGGPRVVKTRTRHAVGLADPQDLVEATRRAMLAGQGSYGADDKEEESVESDEGTPDLWTDPRRARYRQLVTEAIEDRDSGTRLSSQEDFAVYIVGLMDGYKYGASRT